MNIIIILYNENYTEIDKLRDCVVWKKEEGFRVFEDEEHRADRENNRKGKADR